MKMVNIPQVAIISTNLQTTNLFHINGYCIQKLHIKYFDSAVCSLTNVRTIFTNDGFSDWVHLSTAPKSNEVSSSNMRFLSVSDRR
jgi:hypothetical protein